MRIAPSCLALLTAAALAPAAVQAAPAATVAVCTAIENNSCAGAATRFSAGVGRLWGFSQVIDVKDKIVHVWYYNGRELGRIDLPVRAARYRTWSSVTVTKAMVGHWRLEARDASGKLLASFNFTVE